MSEFTNNYEQFIQKAIQAETEALNSKRNQEIIAQLTGIEVREDD